LPLDGVQPTMIFRILRSHWRRLSVVIAAAGTLLLSALGVRTVSKRRTTSRDDAFGAVVENAVDTPPRPQQIVSNRRPGGGGRGTMRDVTDDADTPARTRIMQRVNDEDVAPAEVKRAADVARTHGLSVLVTKQGAEAMLTVRDDMRVGSRMHGADPTFASMSDALQELGAVASDGDVVQLLGTPDANGHWHATIVVDGHRIAIHVVDPGTYRTAARRAGLKVASAVPRLAPPNGRPSLAGRDQARATARSHNDAFGLERDLRRN
jgi:hypothetical protein